MKKSMFVYALAASVALGAGIVSAQEMGTAPVQQPASAPAVAVKPVTDGADLAIQKAEKNVAGLNAIDKSAFEAQKTAVEKGESVTPASQIVASKLAALNLEAKYSKENGSIIVIQTAKARYRNPATDDDFIDKRNLKALEAYLMAKADIIRAINQNFEGLDRSVTVLDSAPNATPEEKAFAEARKAFTKKREELAQQLSEFNQAEEKVLDDASLNNKFGAILDGIAKRLDSSYDPGKLTAKKVAARDAAKAKCEQLKTELDALQQLATKLPKKPTSETESDVKVTASMPLLGATVLTQAESWDPSTREYQMSMAVVWSQKLQDRAKRLMLGDYTPEKVSANSQKLSLVQWMGKQDLRYMVGPRRYTDKDGRNHFIGIAAADLKGPIVEQRGKKRLADMAAVSFVAFSLFGDVEAYSQANRKVEEYTDKFSEEESQKFTKSLVDEISQKVSVSLKGCLPMSQFAIEVSHPIARRPIYVVPFYVDPDLAKDAEKIMKKSYEDAGFVSEADLQFKKRVAGYANGTPNTPPNPVPPPSDPGTHPNPGPGGGTGDNLIDTDF